MLGLESSYILGDADDVERSTVIDIADPPQAREELRSDGEAVIDVRMQIVGEREPFGVVSLSLAVNGQP